MWTLFWVKGPDSMPLGLFSAERPLKKEEPFREERRKMDPPGAPPRGGNPAHRSGPANRGVHHLHPQPGVMGPPGGRGGSGSHKDIKLTLLNKVNVAPVLPCRHGNGSRCGAERLYRLTWVLALKSVFFCHHVWKQQQADKSSRKRYLSSDKNRPGSPPSKRMAFSPDRGGRSHGGGACPTAPG